MAARRAVAISHLSHHDERHHHRQSNRHQRKQGVEGRVHAAAYFQSPAILTAVPGAARFAMHGTPFQGL